MTGERSCAEKYHEPWHAYNFLMGLVFVWHVKLCFCFQAGSTSFSSDCWGFSGPRHRVTNRFQYAKHPSSSHHLHPPRP